MGGLSPKQMTEDANLTINEETTKWLDQPCVSLLGISCTIGGKMCSNDHEDKPLENIFKNPLMLSGRDIDHRKAIGQQATPPIYIVTGSSDSNRNYCYNALCGFKQLNYDVFFDDFKGICHEYQSRTTIDIWTFFKLMN